MGRLFLEGQFKDLEFWFDKVYQRLVPLAVAFDRQFREGERAAERGENQEVEGPAVQAKVLTALAPFPSTTSPAPTSSSEFTLPVPVSATTPPHLFGAIFNGY